VPAEPAREPPARTPTRYFDGREELSRKRVGDDWAFLRTRQARVGLTDDVFSARFAWLTRNKVTPDGLKPHDDLQAEFPYLGLPNVYPAWQPP
jgi:hypothetical protein